MMKKLPAILPAFMNRALRRIFQEGRQVRKLYEGQDYLSAYSKHTDIRVESDYRAAVGGNWEDMGKSQFDFLVGNGLQPEHRLLDFGCGTLRGGRWFIPYLDTGKYTGIEISGKAVEVALRLVDEENLVHKRPNIILNKKPESMFGCLQGQSFDYILAQSVITHLPQELVDELFSALDAVLNADGRFFFTFWSKSKYEPLGVKDFAYPFAYFEELATKYGFVVEDLSALYFHHRGQHMASLARP